ncbi:hypothetical protein ACFX4I_12975 [Peribacillus sp. YIM B13472]|uniref:hypothetical protein n=1 Tax=Peribacillus sp. YIM B13472 TaxID=3366297 RepID=UPI00366F8CAC
MSKRRGEGMAYFTLSGNLAMAFGPSVLVFFFKLSFSGIAPFLPLYTMEKGLTGIQVYFFFTH